MYIFIKYCSTLKDFFSGKIRNAIICAKLIPAKFLEIVIFLKACTERPFFLIKILKIVHPGNSEKTIPDHVKLDWDFFFFVFRVLIDFWGCLFTLIIFIRRFYRGFGFLFFRFFCLLTACLENFLPF